MKSVVDYLSSYLHHIFNDARSTYRKEHEWKKDYLRLSHDLEHHGSHVLTIALPSLGKHFDKCLSEGLYVPPTGPCSGSRGGKSGFPALFRDLLKQVFNEDGVLRDDASVDAVFFLRQLFYGAKKLDIDCPRRVKNEAVYDFLRVEIENRSPSLEWLDCDFNPSASFLLHFGDGRGHEGPQLQLFSTESHDLVENHWLNQLQCVADQTASAFGDLYEEEEGEIPRPGTGAMANAKKHTNRYEFRYWPKRLDSVFPHDLYAMPNMGYSISGHEVDDSWSVHEAPSRLIAVPKTQKGPRLIAAEPYENMWIQQLVRNQLESRVKRTPIAPCIDFSSQERNQRFAMMGSATGHYSTIDLSSASDRLTLWVIERMFRRNQTLLHRLQASRTGWVVNTVSNNHWDYLVLKKFATQGSACTFPVQTIVYSIVAVCGVLLSRRWDVTTRNMRVASQDVCVFGDDIIVPPEAVRYVVALLEYLGLKVNNDKTHVKGNFRESCGMDAFKGYNVTPKYIRRPELQAQQSSYASTMKVSNNFHRAGLWETANWLRSTIRDRNHLIPVVRINSGVLGAESFCGAGNNAHLKKRYLAEHQVEVVRVNTLTTKVPKLDMPGTSRLFQYFTEKPIPETKWSSGVNGRPVSTVRPGWVPLHLLDHQENPFDPLSDLRSVSNNP